MKDIDVNNLIYIDETGIDNNIAPICLCMELKPNQVVIMDNASFHKSAKVKGLIEKVGCKIIYLLPYSPDLNPIEHVWANLKRLVRKHPKREQNLSEAISD